MSVRMTESSGKTDTTITGISRWIGRFVCMALSGNCRTVLSLLIRRFLGSQGMACGRCGQTTHMPAFEICEDGLADRSYFEKVYKEAIELCAYLCRLYNLNPLETVSSSATTKVIKEALLPIRGIRDTGFQNLKEHDTFRQDVKRLMGGGTVTPKPPKPEGGISSSKVLAG